MNSQRNKQKIVTALVLGTAFVLVSQVAKADTIMNITGNIKASPCTINVPAGGLNVDLGQNIQAASLVAPGAASDWKSFSIALTACPTSTATVTLTMSGTPDNDDSTMYANTGTAENAQIEVQNSEGTRLGNAVQYTKNIDSASRGAEFDLQARAYTVNGNVTPGTINGVLLATFIYE
ncbi:fimbrial protein [Rahnella selenatireducens]|uniref:fimbrial protein n=1 Tax=Rahnella selenatireducens TaxID=3389797 RepID=UPI00396830BD